MKDIVQWRKNDKFNEDDFTHFMWEAAEQAEKIHEETWSRQERDFFHDRDVESENDKPLNISKDKYTKTFPGLKKSLR